MPQKTEVNRYAWNQANPNVKAMADLLPKRTDPKIRRLEFEAATPSIEFQSSGDWTFSEYQGLHRFPFRRCRGLGISVLGTRTTFFLGMSFILRLIPI